MCLSCGCLLFDQRIADSHTACHCECHPHHCVSFLCRRSIVSGGTYWDGVSTNGIALCTDCRRRWDGTSNTVTATSGAHTRCPCCCIDPHTHAQGVPGTRMHMDRSDDLHHSRGVRVGDNHHVDTNHPLNTVPGNHPDHGPVVPVNQNSPHPPVCHFHHRRHRLVADCIKENENR